MARQAELDLVEVAPNAEPPVCRIMDFGKYIYELKRKEKVSQKKQHTITVKEIRIRPKIDPHDLQTKINHARKFFEKDYRVQFSMMFRGREMMHVDHGKQIMAEIIEKTQDLAKIDRPTEIQGRQMMLMLAPK